ncbi:MAG: SIMPL domain-containing protein [Streptosporangiaceae bacterium]
MADELPVISVRGEGHLEVDPEIARVSVAVSGRDAHRARTLELVEARQRAVREVLDAFADGLEDVETSHVRVAPRYPRRGHGETVVGYTAEVWYTITVAGLDLAGDLLARLAEVESAQVHGPEWELRPTSPAYRCAREAAVADAVARASDYAAALGARLVDVLELADTGLLHHPEREAPHRVRAMALAASAEAGPPSFDLESGRRQVEATVEARFTMTAPTLPSEAG